MFYFFFMLVTTWDMGGVLSEAYIYNNRLLASLSNKRKWQISYDIGIRIPHVTFSVCLLAKGKCCLVQIYRLL